MKCKRINYYYKIETKRTWRKNVSQRYGLLQTLGKKLTLNNNAITRVKMSVSLKTFQGC